jgi:hypothetical protein
MTMLRGLADDLRLDVWLMGYMMPVERAFVRPDFVTLGTSLACAEMIRSGTTCFADIVLLRGVGGGSGRRCRPARAVHADGADVSVARLSPTRCCARRGWALPLRHLSLRAGPAHRNLTECSPLREDIGWSAGGCFPLPSSMSVARYTDMYGREEWSV